LIVDPSPDNREVLRTALQRRGMAIVEAECPADGVRMAAQHQPDLIVVDLDIDIAAAARLPADLAATSRHKATPIILLGSIKVAPRAQRSVFVRKPYHYAPLVRRIESLLTKAA
jgi:two-component system cell cycle response regulator DivK